MKPCFLKLKGLIDIGPSFDRYNMYTDLLFTSLANCRHESLVDLLLHRPISVLLHFLSCCKFYDMWVPSVAASSDTICRVQRAPHPSPGRPPQQGAGPREQTTPLVPSRMCAAGRVLWRSKANRALSQLFRCGKNKTPLSLDVHVLLQQNILTWWLLATQQLSRIIVSFSS